MSNVFSVFCDESCHLEHDGQKVMVLGGIWCEDAAKHEAYGRIREIKKRHELPSHAEVKWTKISNNNVNAYLDLVDYFFDNSCLHFRCIVIPDKHRLDHDKYGQTHDEWYYKMYFEMLKNIISQESSYNIYLDIKDTVGSTKIENLRDVLRNNAYDFDRKIVRRIQLVRSHEIELLQLADILIGAIMATNRGDIKSPAKRQVVKKIKSRSSFSLTNTTLLREDKMNIFIWKPDWGK